MKTYCESSSVLSYHNTLLNIAPYQNETIVRQSIILLKGCTVVANNLIMKSTQVQTLGAGHALAKHLVGSEDIKHYVEIHVRA